MTTNETFAAALERFIRTVSEYRKARLIRDFGQDGFDRTHSTQWQLSVDAGGRKYIRICAPSGPGRSAFCFVEVATGNVLKADGWKKPARGARGNIYAADFGGYGVTEFGAQYR